MYPQAVRNFVEIFGRIEFQREQLIPVTLSLEFAYWNRPAILDVERRDNIIFNLKIIGD
jgi:hypothetical protein